MNYSSELSSWKKEYEDAKAFLTANRYFTKALRYCSDSTKESINQIINNVNSYYFDKIAKSENEDNTSINYLKEIQIEKYTCNLPKVEEKSKKSKEEKTAKTASLLAEKKKKKRMYIIIGTGLAVLLIAFFIWYIFIQPSIIQSQINSAIENNDFDTALKLYRKNGDTSHDNDLKYQKAVYLESMESFTEALEIYNQLGDYKDSMDRKDRINSVKIDELIAKTNYDLAIHYALLLSPEMSDKKRGFIKKCGQI